jgi:3-hydroxy-9,10-secoandrosta-1,3,5(10)-triene-9,17-dione monooxygenase
MDTVKPTSNGAAPDRNAILVRARELIPTLNARSARAEELRRAPEETIADCVSAGLLRVVQPARFRGYELDWDVLCEMAMLLARGCSSQGWVVTVLAEHAWFAGLFPLESQQDIWGSNPDALVSTSFVPAGSAKRVDGGFVLDGQWPFSSGVHHADWTIVGEFLREPQRPPALHFFLLPKSDLRIIDDWDTLGMVGTGSCSVGLKEAFVPAHRCLASSLIAAGDTPGAALSTAPIFRMPLSGFAPTVLAAVLVGASEAMLELFTSSVSAKARGGAAVPGLELALSRIATSSAEINAARLLILESTKANMAKLRMGGKLADYDAQSTARDSSYAAVLCSRAARQLFEASGARGIYRTSPLQRLFRDVTSAATHAALNWDKISVAYGRNALGM